MPDDPFDWRSYELEPEGESGGGHCDCCGTTTKRVWGFISRADQAVGIYYVAWTVGKPDHGGTYDLILGKWGEDSSARDRYAVALDFRIVDGEAQFGVIDATDRLAGSSLFDTRLKRSEVIGTPLAPQVFAIVDAVYTAPELEELRGWSE